MTWFFRKFGKKTVKSPSLIPIGSIYGIFAYIYHKINQYYGKYHSPMDPSWDRRENIRLGCVCFFGELFTDCTTVNHHCLPPFG